MLPLENRRSVAETAAPLYPSKANSVSDLLGYVSINCCRADGPSDICFYPGHKTEEEEAQITALS